MKPTDTGRIGTLVLLAAVALAAVVVQLVERHSRAAIEAQQAALEWRRLRQVLPEALRALEAEPLRALPGAPAQVLRAFRVRGPAGGVRALLARGRARGCYVEPIEFALAIAADGRVLGMRILAHHETPGLGAKAADPELEWTGQFAGLPARAARRPDWALRANGGRFDAVSGATTTSACLVAGTAAVLAWFDRHRQALLASEREAPARRLAHWSTVQNRHFR